MFLSRFRAGYVSSFGSLRWLGGRPRIGLPLFSGSKEQYQYRADSLAEKIPDLSARTQCISTDTQASAYFEGENISDFSNRSLTRTIVRRMTVQELRNELELRGIDSSGLREVLELKLLDAISKPDLHQQTTRQNDSDIFEPMLHPNRTYALRFRGRTNPSQSTAGVGIALYDTVDGSEVWYAQQFVNDMRSFQVEYTAIIMGLKYARQLGAGKIVLQSDNDVIIKQLKGEYKVNKEELRRLYWAACHVMEENFFSVDMQHITRESNARVTDLAMKALGTRKSFGINHIEDKTESTDRHLKNPSLTSAARGELSISPEQRYLLRVDGGARGNPGAAGAGMVIYDSTGREIWCGWKFIDEATNNLAEYAALILGLQCARSLGITQLSVESDSLLVVKQVVGKFKVKDSRLKPMYKTAVDELNNFADISVQHIFRKENRRADELANQAMDTKDSHGFDEV